MMVMRHFGVAADSVGFECTVLGGYTVDVHGTVAALSCDVFVERIPGNALDEVIVFCDFADTFSY